MRSHILSNIFLGCSSNRNDEAIETPTAIDESQSDILHRTFDAVEHTIPYIDQDRSENECESDESSMGNTKGWQEIHLREDIATDEDSIVTDLSSNEDDPDVNEFPMDMDNNDDPGNGENAPHDIVNDVLMFKEAGLTQVFIMTTFNCI